MTTLLIAILYSASFILAAFWLNARLEAKHRAILLFCGCLGSIAASGAESAFSPARQTFDLCAVDGDTARMYGAVEETIMGLKECPKVGLNPKPVQFRPQVVNLPTQSKREAPLGNAINKAVSYVDDPQFGAYSISSRIGASVDPNARLCENQAPGVIFRTDAGAFNFPTESKAERQS